MNTLFDTHCHIDDERFNEDRDEALARMAENCVSRAVIVGSDMATSQSAVDFANAHEGFYAAVGVHPHEAKYFKRDDLATIGKWFETEKKVVALGEIGLDYYYDLSPRDVQREVFMTQLDWAWEHDKPVIFHIRDAHGDILDLLRSRKEKLPSGIIHCFSGSWECAKEYLKMGFYISFAGPLTFKKAPNLWETAQKAPLDRLLIETDSPYLTPVPFRGKRNEPGYVRFVAEKLAELRGLTPEEIGQITTQNALRVYRLAD
ncbi:MAG: TatD family hydrolase [Clostridia bacterium]|nr:TatD family hydrolase [Clostridia bacterium]